MSNVISGAVLSRQLVDESYFCTRHEAVDIDQNQHPLIERAKTGQIGCVEGCTHCWRRLDLLGRERDNVGHAVNHHPDDPMCNIEDDDDRELIIGWCAEIELDAHVDNRHDNASQVDDAFDEIRCIGNSCHRVIATDLLHRQDIDAIFFTAKFEGE
jgi:hypothetical protein